MRQPADKLSGVQLQASGKFEDVVQGEIALSTLDLTDEGPVQTHGFCQAFLAQAQLVTTLTNTAPELGSRR